MRTSARRCYPHCAWAGIPHNTNMSILNEEDRGIETDPGTPERIDQDQDGIAEDGLGNPAAPEDDSGH